MKRSVLAAALMIAGVFSVSVQAVDTIEWVGPSAGADWNDPNVWKNTTTNVTGNAETLMGQRNGSDGKNNADPGVSRARNIVIGGADVVEYDRRVPNSDFRILQGSNLTIKEGGVWVQDSADYVENAWTQMDASNLILDNGTFRRTGESLGGDGGGILMFGSYRSDANFSTLPAPAVINVQIKNGGRLENTGSLWFGAEDEHPDNLVGSVEINNGSIDLTGGDTFGVSNGGTFWGDTYANLAFWYGRDLGGFNGSLNDGLPKDEQYELNFTGPGSITVDTINAPAPTAYLDIVQHPAKPAVVHGSGIRIYRQGEDFTWTETKASYEDLWNAGILKSKGMSGLETTPGSGIPSTPFANHFTVTGTPDSDNYVLTRKNPTVVTWQGGAGEWNELTNWTDGTLTNQSAVTLLGSNRGTGGGEDIVLDGSKPGGAAVAFDPNSVGDFRMEVGEGVSSLTIKNGASLTIHSASDTDSKWTRMSSDLILDNGTIRRTKDGVNSINGGLFMVGGFAQRRGLEIDVTLTNGGRIENDGQLWIGSPSPGDNATGLEVTVTINNGTIDLTGGDTEVDASGLTTLASVALGLNPDLVFTYLFRSADNNTEGPAGPAGEKYAINFTGPGSITVDHSGIYVITENDNTGTNFTANDTTYQDLWALGILQANGLSGLNGATFADFFTTSGTLGQDNYKLNSLVGGFNGDADGDGDVDGNDLLVIQRGIGGAHNAASITAWKANFGQTGSVAAAGAVPEPATWAIAMLGLGCFGVWRSRRPAQA